MPVTYPTAVKTARMDAVKTALGASGKLEIGTAGMAQVLATIALGAGGSVANGVWTLISGATSVTASAGGTAAAARIRTSGNTDIVTGLTVGTSGSDINLDNVNMASGQTVTIIGASITHA